MPNRNGTGPQGAGPATGRGMGPCDRNNQQSRGLGALSRQRLSNRDEKTTLETEEKKVLED